MPGESANRVIHHGDGIEWLKSSDLEENQAVVTSLPDVSELPELGFEGWQEWFTSVSELICASVDPRSVAIFYQSDIKHEGRWIDKSFLVSKGAEAAGSFLLWRKVACRVEPGLVSFGRPAYGHLLCFSREHRITPAQSSADVLPKLGQMSWSRAIGTEVCDAIISFLQKHTRCDTVVDPFCGLGSILAAANARGLHAIGVEKSKKRVRKARRLEVPEAGATTAE